MNIKDRRYIGSFIDGCLENPSITEDEKVLLMKLGSIYGYKLNWYCSYDDSIIEGCKSVDDIIRRLGYNLSPNI